MYLSRLTLDPRHPGARRDAANPYELHSTLARVLDGGAPALWRLEDATLLVQTTTRPDWRRLEPGYLAREVEGKPLDLDALVTPERLYRFRLRANPTVTRAGKREGLHRLEAQLDWLTRQGDRAGFHPAGATVTSADTLRVRKRDAAAPITVLAVTFDGHLRVRDPHALRDALARGLGHAKAFGLGLLSLAPQRG